MLGRDELKMLPVGAISALSRDEKLMAWQEAQRELVPLAMRERDLRVMAVEAAFGSELPEGTQSLDIGHDYLCKVEVKMNYTVADTPEMRNEFIEVLGTERATNTVKFKPNLSISAWKGLTQEERDKLATHVTIKPGLPSLSILAPGDPGNKR